MKVFSVAGFHHTGKTTVVVNLIRELKRRHHQVVSIKDIHAENFTMEKEGSNSWNHWLASNDVVFARGLTETYQIWHRHLSLSEMLAHLAADYVVVEGMRSAPLPRIICADSPEQLQETVDDTVFAISGKISERIDEWNDIPVINARKNIIKLADLTEEKVFAVLPLANAECCRACGYSCQEMVGAILAGKMNRKDCLLLKNEQIGIKVDGRQLTLVPFVRNLFTAIINSLVGNLEGGKGKKIEIIIDE